MISQRTLSCLSVLSSDRDPPGKQLRSLGGGDLDLNVVARPGCGLLDPNDPVRVDAFPEAAALGGAGLVDALDQHLEPAADPGGLHLGQHALLQLLDPLHAGAGRAGGHAPIEVEGGGAVLGRIREEGDPIQACRSPGNPRMKLERKAASRSSDRIRSISRRKAAVEPPRRIRRSTGSLTCWSERSK